MPFSLIHLKYLKIQVLAWVYSINAVEIEAINGSVETSTSVDFKI